MVKFYRNYWRSHCMAGHLCSSERSYKIEPPVCGYFLPGISFKPLGYQVQSATPQAHLRYRHRPQEKKRNIGLSPPHSPRDYPPRLPILPGTTTPPPLPPPFTPVQSPTQQGPRGGCIQHPCMPRAGDLQLGAGLTLRWMLSP